MSGDLKVCAETVPIETKDERRRANTVEQRRPGQFKRRGRIAAARFPAVDLLDLEGARSTTALSAGQPIQSIGTLHGGKYHGLIHGRVEYINKKVISVL